MDQGTIEPNGIDESKGFDVGIVDIVLGTLTAPLFLFVLQFAVTGAESLLATRAQRVKVYLALLAIEIVVVVALVAWFTR